MTNPGWSMKPRPAPSLAMRTLAMVILAAAVLGAISIAARGEQIASTPPARFDHPYRGKVRIIDHPDSVAACRRHGVAADACSWIAPGRDRECAIIVPFGVSSRTRASVVRHEVGHCNGWPAGHPR